MRCIHLMYTWTKMWLRRYFYISITNHQIKSFLLVYEALKTTINDQGVVWVYGKGHQGVSFCVGRCVLREWDCGRWVRWVLRGTVTTSGHPGVPWKISPTMRWLSQPAVFSKMGLPEWWRWISDGSYSIAVGGTWMRGRVALCGLDRRRWFLTYIRMLTYQMLCKHKCRSRFYKWTALTNCNELWPTLFTCIYAY